MRASLVQRIPCYLYSIGHLFPRYPAATGPNHLIPAAARSHILAMFPPPLLERVSWIIEIAESSAEVVHIMPVYLLIPTEWDSSGTSALSLSLVPRV